MGEAMVKVIGDSTLGEIEESELPDGVAPEDLTPVEDVTRNLRGLFKSFDKFDDSYLVGEVTNLSTNSKHLYFSIKAANGNEEIKCVVWNSTRRHLDVEIESEMIVAVKGTLNFFEGGGHPNLEVSEAHLVGESAYWQRIKALREQLDQEGLFDEDRKASLPLLPETIGLVTATGSDAEQDFIETVHRRYPDVDIVVANSTVQGDGAPKAVATAVRSLEEDDVDVTVVTRGGGSDTALRAFNEEPVVRAIAETETPTVVAIGHDADAPLVDDVADHRAKTPTAAGEVVVEDKSEKLEQLEEIQTAIKQAYDAQVRRWLNTTRKEIDTTYSTHCDQWVDSRQTAIDTEYAALASQWYETIRQSVESEYRNTTEQWVATRRAAVGSEYEHFIDQWISTAKRDIDTAYRDHAQGWLTDHRDAIEQETARLEREHSFEQEKEGLEQQNTALLVLVVLLVLALIVVGALALGII
jgi:exodeoxyribonuclease VII large subunit